MYRQIKYLTFIASLTFLTMQLCAQENINTYEINNGDTVRFQVPQKFKIALNDTINRLDNSLTPQGEWVHLYLDGNFKCSGFYKNGRKDGFWQKMYPNGNLQYQINMRKGYLNGYGKFYYHNGNLEEEGYFSKGLEHGLFKKYSKNGKLEAVTEYKYGRSIGLGENDNRDRNFIPEDNLPHDSLNGKIKIKGEVIYKKRKIENAIVYSDDAEVTTDSIGSFEIQIDSLGQTIQIFTFGYNFLQITIQDTSFLRIKLKKGLFSRGSRCRVCGFCFSKGTNVLMADSSSKKIETIKEGDVILTVNVHDRTIHKDTVVRVDSVLHDNIIQITFENGLTIQSTTDHPYFVDGKGWCSRSPNETADNYGIPTQQLTIGDSCLVLKNGQLEKIALTTIQTITGTQITYNISGLTTNDNYFANGILVSNESRLTVKTRR